MEQDANDICERRRCDDDKKRANRETPGFIKQNRSLYPGGPNDFPKRGKRIWQFPKNMKRNKLIGGNTIVPKTNLTLPPSARFSLLIIDTMRMKTGVGRYNFSFSFFFSGEFRNSAVKSGVRYSLCVNLCDKAFNLTGVIFSMKYYPRRK